VDNTQNIISFCTGYGGLELGIRRAGVDVRTIVNVEIEAFCCANLVAKTEEGRMDNAPIWTDLKTFPAREFRGKICGLIGGYPCQPFSSAGKRQGEKDPRHLWPYILKHVRAIRPVWCFWENVAGHTTMGLWRVLSDLEEEGYRTTFGIFSAEEVGAPHQRKRVFILAYRADFGQQWSGRSNKESSSHTIEGCGDGASPTREELGNSTSKRPCGGSENCEGEQSEVLGERLESDELANPTSRQPRQSQARNGGQDTSGGSEEELANSAGRRFEQCESESKEERRTCCESSHTQWPARPGEEQYEWEEPRVVGDTKCERLQGESGEEQHAKENNQADKEPTKAQSFVGGESHGTQHRVDRLRLLGNGVVPQTAELAWKTLWKELISPSPQNK
jgi:DNA (cytosine-5)-methyltransferase 1